MRIGIDLGGTKIEGIVLQSRNRVLKRLRLPTPQGDYAATLQTIASLVRELESGFPAFCEKIPVGIATPGSISKLIGRMKNCNSTCLNGKPLKQDLERLLACEVRIANDADCFALSEAIDGAASDFTSVFGVILGTGVGGGIVVNKQLLSGPNNIAGEWGHNPMPPLISSGQEEGALRPCYCGRNGCIEAYLSGPALKKTYSLETGRSQTVADIVFQAGRGQPVEEKVITDYVESLAAALATVINIMDPEVIVLGGGLSNIECLYQEVPLRWGKYVFSDRCETRLLKATYGDSSGGRGAAWLWP